MNYDQLLFSQLRLVAVKTGSAQPDDAGILKAVTVNEELLNIGYTLNTKNILALAASEDIGSFYARVREYAGDVKAEPMYPDFPNQVMEMGEAEFRFHQYLHYFTTYGLETLIEGAKVSRGWLPDVSATEKTVSDDTLLSAKVIALIDESEKYILPYKRILSKTERMDDKERMIICECVKNLSPEALSSVSITFKQNLLEVFNAIFTMDSLSSGEKAGFLHAVCQHTGDVWKCFDYALTHAGFHLKTSQKRLIVKLLESYPLPDFRENLVISNKKAERTLLMLKYLDFNEYTRKEGFGKAVAQLRQGRIRSWESGVKYLVGRGLPEALEEYSKRPGMMLRHITYLLRNGYKAEDIFSGLQPNAEKLKTQTLVSLTSFARRPELDTADEQHFREGQALGMMMRTLLPRRLAANDTPIRGKKVFVDDKDYDLRLSAIRVTDKSSEGGYIRSGIAYRIPEEVERLRFFVYWNDKNRVDVDLHATALNLDGHTSFIGWNANFKDGTLVFSGDITHSDAAEYIDIDLVKGKDTLSTVWTTINLFSGYKTFREVDECFVGAMAVSKTGEEVKLYDPKNCFFTHYLTGKYRMLSYGYVDVQNRVIVFDGIENDLDYYSTFKRNNGFTVYDYLDILFESQGAAFVDSREAADVVLVIGKPSNEKEISLIDNNFFMEG